ncbi:MAG: GIY-YIG nuclease family protein [Pseudanabaena sp.]|nr:GIY-YIG nuclease family protein [Pseudanabaena sp. M109S1SP1A06QC]MCA6596668.1 GIY-YIG nuclease family protein [Pseudanabaena sp. M046S1SP1A06QC]MCA6604839.1 GIY-YIG nuclease family protein [Pseudanabaena sp. M007S1SP1A06QC]MCA6615337.1 GIY-YIG nuclease family protein [Pseudanabaena sp. M090S1SP1A06QC]
MDRVNELGDASVSFPFEVHAIIFCQNAPELAKLLHKRFHLRRVNKVNERKEFFKVDIEEIAEAVKQIAKEINSIQGEIHITKSAAAMDYRKTVAILEKRYQAK